MCMVMVAISSFIVIQDRVINAVDSEIGAVRDIRCDLYCYQFDNFVVICHVGGDNLGVMAIFVNGCLVRSVFDFVIGDVFELELFDLVSELVLISDGDILFTGIFYI